jgi:ribosomal protein S18 acetylase RimI-like enzyme
MASLNNSDYLGKHKHKYGFVEIENPESDYDFNAPEYLLRKATPEQRRTMMINIIADDNHHVFPIVCLADTFAVSERTIQTDLKLLRKKGLVKILPNFDGKVQSASKLIYIGPIRTKEAKRMKAELLYDPTKTGGIRDFDWADYSFVPSKGVYGELEMDEAMTKQDIDSQIYSHSNAKTYEFLRLILKKTYSKIDETNHSTIVSEDEEKKLIYLDANDNFSFNFYDFTIGGYLVFKKANTRFDSILLSCNSKTLGNVKRRKAYDFTFSKRTSDINGQYDDRLDVSCRVVERRKQRKTYSLPSHVSFRTGLDSDIDGISSLYFKSFDETYKEVLPDLALKSPSSKKNAEGFEKGNDKFCIAVCDRKLIGFVSYKKTTLDNPDYYFAGEITGIYVLKEHQNKGIGTALMDMAIKENNRKQMLLSVINIDKKEETFFRHYGFKSIEKRTKKINEQEVTENTFLLS